MTGSGKGLSVAVIGYGRMGRLRVAALQRLSADVTFVSDPDPAAGELCRAAGLPWHADLHELRLPELDALFLCTPPFTRGELERQCVAARVPFFAEKPVGLSAKSMEGLVAALRDQPLVTAVGYMNRYRRSVRAARERVHAGGLLGLSGKWAGRKYARDWWHDRERSGGPLNEQTTHLIDLVRFLGGEVRSVAALAAPDQSALALALQLDSGAHAALLYSCNAEEKSISMDVVFGDGFKRLEGWDFADELDASEGDDPNAVFEVETDAFLRAIGGDRDAVLCDFEDAARTQAVVDAVIESATSGRSLTVA